MATYLVTGGAGFIGSHLVDRLVQDGHHVRVIDNLSTGKRNRVHMNAAFYEVDFRDLEAIKPYFVGVDGVFHVGALPRVPYSIQQPVETSETNIMGTLNVLMAARDAKVKRFVYSASSSAYGDQTVYPLHTGLKPNPLNPYAVQKYVGEHFTRLFAELYGMETVSLRYFNVYGPRMADEGAYVTVIAIFKRQRKAGDVLTIEGDGEQKRDFTHVSDVVRANVLAMQSSRVGKGEVVNIGAGDCHSVNEIARIIGGPVSFIPARIGDPRMTLADISKTKELLGWEPTVNFFDGVRDVLRREGIEPAA